MSSNSSGLFLETATLDIEAKMHSKCLACLSFPVKVAHLIAKMDTAVSHNQASNQQFTNYLERSTGLLPHPLRICNV